MRLYKRLEKMQFFFREGKNLSWRWSGIALYYKTSEMKIVFFYNFFGIIIMTLSLYVARSVE